VDRSRDGASFSNRRVLAIQHGQQIFHMSASFQIEERAGSPGAGAAVTPPEQLPDLAAQMRQHLHDCPREAALLVRSIGR